jgi:molybdopterin/thiamine biosynthesis adenylyltransferase
MTMTMTMTAARETAYAQRRVLLIGVGGLGCPAAIALARAGVGTIGIADDDEVDLSNLHRQILFDDSDVGRPKVPAARAALEKIAGPSIRIETYGRFLPTNAVALASEYELIVEGSDNFATKFLAADACKIAKRPIVHAAAVRWHGTALAVSGQGQPCYRCLFEDVPLENPPNCAEAGVVGPMVGVVAAAQADLALSILDGDESVFGELFTFDGKTRTARRRHIASRRDCPLCRPLPSISTIERSRYVEGLCQQAN